ncbi:hypothetical protein [Candidatus Uabimicrobium amorphum]|uniref:Uncharacterized protein n=1 Tax=Uabimicrobium amorphum TaxID=2596890 RepID=A0A5S9F4T4_UABAM|nr:hypothetical protein [Candidatus Uabimicrobium amorphum]BBM86137.1 hypothetical protein UABAM_04523 [Candidatus Uabimicrobium amorphum]
MKLAVFSITLLLLIPLYADYIGPKKTVFRDIPAHKSIGKTWNSNFGSSTKIIAKEEQFFFKARNSIKILPKTVIKKGAHFNASISREIPTKLSLTGITELYEGKQANYTVRVYFPGSSQDVTNSCKWDVSHKDYAEITPDGKLRAKNVPHDIDIDVVARLHYQGFVIEINLQVRILALAITELKIDLEEPLREQGYELILEQHSDFGQDLNEGSRGKTIYLGMKKEYVDPNKRIIGIAIIAADTSRPKLEKGYAINRAGDCNMEIGGGSAHVNLFFKRGYGYHPITDIAVLRSQATDEKHRDFEVIPFDINFGSGSATEHFDGTKTKKHGIPLYIAIKNGEETIHFAYGSESDYGITRYSDNITRAVKDAEKAFGDVEKAYNKAKTALNKIQKKIGSIADYETNKWRIKDEIRDGGWRVAWGRELTETDLLEFIATIGADFLGGGGVATTAKLKKLGFESIEELTSSVIEEFTEYFSEETKKLIDEITGYSGKVIGIFFQALIDGDNPKKAVAAFMQEKSREIGGIRVHFKAGVAEYSGSNKLFGKTISKTFSWQPYIAVRIVRGK